MSELLRAGGRTDGQCVCGGGAYPGPMPILLGVPSMAGGGWGQGQDTRWKARTSGSNGRGWLVLWEEVSGSRYSCGIGQVQGWAKRLGWEGGLIPPSLCEFSLSSPYLECHHAPPPPTWS